MSKETCAAHTGGKPWHHPCDSSFIGRQHARIVGSERFLPRFQRKASEARQGAPEKIMQEAGEMKPKMQQKLQDVRDAKDMECLPRKAAGCEESQLMREAVWAATSKAIWVERPSSLELTSHNPVSNAGYGFNVLFAGFLSCLGPVIFLPFGREIFTLHHCTLGF